MSRIFLLIAFMLTLIAFPTSAQTEQRPLLLAHYMPWYQTPEISGYWGWHWTMDHFDPEQGEFASHYTPLIGLYDSQDNDLLEYQVLLMRLSGIDGVIVDWYGTEDFRDYAVLNAATGKLFDYAKRTGLSFAICYEDLSVKFMVDEGVISEPERHANSQAAIQYAEQNWFNDSIYLRYQDQPLLFLYGPHYFRTPDDWETIFSALDRPPALVTLDGFMDWAALSSYPWPPMHMAGGAELVPAVLESYLELFYRNARRRDYSVGGAFAGFHDIYAAAGVRSSFGYLDPRDGETLQMTLDLALANEVDAIQLVTWNDYGEGTMIEPTEETGYRYLEIVQETRKSLSEFTFSADDLRLPLILFQLRKTHAGDTDIQARLDDVFNAIVASDLDTARTISDEF